MDAKHATVDSTVVRFGVISPAADESLADRGCRMGFVGAVDSGITRWADFSGRATRSEYWYFNLFWLLALVVWSLVAGLTATFLHREWPVAVFGLVAMLSIIPMVAITARRLHDGNRSAWWLLALLVGPVGGALGSLWGLAQWFLILWFGTQSTFPSANIYGPVPSSTGAPEPVSLAERFGGWLRVFWLYVLAPIVAPVLALPIFLLGSLGRPLQILQLVVLLGLYSLHPWAAVAEAVLFLAWYGLAGPRDLGAFLLNVGLTLGWLLSYSNSPVADSLWRFPLACLVGYYVGAVLGLLPGIVQQAALRDHYRRTGFPDLAASL
ncbi:MAG: DUF805 domain-containing protein [Dehalococcoidia bacterium]